MKSQPRTVIHVGYPKCGSTSIQQNFLSCIPGATYVAREDCAGDPEYLALYERISRHSLRLGKGVAESGVLWKRLAETQFDGGLLLFSDERITLPGVSGANLLLLERPYIAKQVFGQGRIILVLRQPVDLLRSMYQNYVINSVGSNKKPKLMGEWLGRDMLLSKFRNGAVGQVLFFAELAIRYQEFFGKENVGVFFLEDMQADAEKFYRDLGAFIGLECALELPGTQRHARNVTADKPVLSEISKIIPAIAHPQLPPEHEQQVHEITRLQIHYLKKCTGVDALARWKEYS